MLTFSGDRMKFVRGTLLPPLVDGYNKAHREEGIETNTHASTSRGDFCITPQGDKILSLHLSSHNLFVIFEKQHHQTRKK